MEHLNFELGDLHLKKITSALRRRDLAPEIDGEGWQVHGPHSGCKYQMYEGWAYDLDNPNEFIYVHILSRFVYEVDPGDNNNQYTEENLIPIV
jgi:hypothetical protein